MLEFMEVEIDDFCLPVFSGTLMMVTHGFACTIVYKPF